MWLTDSSRRLSSSNVQWGWKKDTDTSSVGPVWSVCIFFFFVLFFATRKVHPDCIKKKRSNPARGRGRGRPRSKLEKAINIFFQPHFIIVVSVIHVWCKSILIWHVKITCQQYFLDGFEMNLDFGASIQILNLMVPFRACPRRFISRHFSALC